MVLQRLVFIDSHTDKEASTKIYQYGIGEGSFVSCDIRTKCQYDIMRIYVTGAE